jgi:choline dehydrogenase-like flavoprotein
MYVPKAPKLEYGKVVLEDILIKAGCDPYNMHHSDRVISHPGGTAPVGKIVNAHLETQIKNLYCCDTSVMPEAPGRPPTLTLVCLAKRLADRLNSII